MLAYCSIVDHKAVRGGRSSIIADRVLKSELGETMDASDCSQMSRTTGVVGRAEETRLDPC